jgi:PBSX family phage terminase large subunit
MPRVIIPHEYQKRVLLSKKRFVVAIAGIQGGKTLCGVLWLIQEIKKNPRGTFLVGAPSFKILNQSTLEKIFELMPEGVWGSYNKMEQVYRLKSGGKIFFRSLESPDSIEGMTAHAAWLDEAGQMKYRAWVNVLSRVSATNGRVLITTSPYTVNWLYKQIYQKVKNKELGYENFEIVEWESIHNPYFPKENYEHARMVLPLSEFERKYKGMFRRMQGLVYEDIFDEEGNIRNVVLDVPKFQKVICGIDWGYRDPTAIAFLGITENGQVYLFDEVYKSGLTILDVISILKEKVLENRVGFVYAGKDQPGYIDELNLKGVPTMAANNDIFFGIGRVRALIRMGRFFIHRRCVNALEEFTLYVYKESDKMVEEPADENNHMMDAIRYAIASHPEFMQIENEGKVYSADQKTNEFWNEVKQDIERSYQRLKFGDYDEEDYWNMIQEVI